MSCIINQYLVYDITYHIQDTPHYTIFRRAKERGELHFVLNILHMVNIDFAF